MRKKGGGHNKGSSFERAICKQLSLWWTGGKRDDIFWRTAGSGARATVRRRKNCATANSAGDVCALDAEGEPFIRQILIELKKGYTKDIDVLKFIDALDGRKACLLWRWMDKAWGEAYDNKRREAWVIFQRDRSKAMLMIRAGFLVNLDRGDQLSYPYSKIEIDWVGKRIAIVVLADFLGWYKPPQIIATPKSGKTLKRL